MKKIFWTLYAKIVKVVFLNPRRLRKHFGGIFPEEDLEVLGKVMKDSVDREFSKKVEAE